jgi:Fis family transcriptional regulator
MSPASKVKKGSAQKKRTNGLGQHVKDAMDNYFSDLDGCDSTDLYELVLSEVEKPLFEAVMQNTRGNISRASEVLGMNRGTLRTRLRKYGLEK